MWKFIFPWAISAVTIVYAAVYAAAHAAEMQTGTSFGCQTYADPQGMIHIRGETEESAMACWGYVHARDRAWQVDYLRKIAQGRKAEVVGTSGIKSDVFLRLLNLTALAAKITEGLPKEFKPFLEAYARGINLGLTAALKQGVPEFKKLGYKPEPWKVEDSILIALLQVLDQTRRSFEQDIREEKQKSIFAEKTEFLFTQDGNPWDVSILKRGEFKEKVDTLYAEVKETSARQWIESALDELPDLSPAGAGSNNWVIAPHRSKTGHAWLANDPHLNLRRPSFWHWVHVSGGALEAMGIAVPGFPMMGNGVNLKVAWGLTTSYLDVADVWEVPESDLVKTQSERPWIWFRWWKIKLPFFFKKIRWTEQGWPILPSSAPAGKAWVLRWTLEKMTGLDFFHLFAMMHASSADEMNQRLEHAHVPSWNMVFADTAGQIGYRTTGWVPKRSQKEFGVEHGSLADSDRWKMLDAEEMPHLMRPARGFISTANNRQWPKESAFHGGRGYSLGFRAFRIEELIQAQSKHDFDSQKGIQCDVQVTDARFFLPVLLMHAPKDMPELIGQLLRSWDMRATHECKACAVFRRWIEKLQEKQGFTIGALYRWLKTADTADIDPVVAEAFRGMQKDLKIELPMAEMPTWGKLHRQEFRHLSELPGLVPHESMPSQGDEFTVNPGSGDWVGDHWDHDHGASARVIVEMTSPPTIHGVLAGTDGGTEHFLTDPNSPWQRWERCEYQQRIFPLNWSEVVSETIRF